MNREEVTTEGRLDIAGQLERMKQVVESQDAGVSVGWFIDAEPRQVRASAGIQTLFIELSAGQYAEANNEQS